MFFVLGGRAQGKLEFAKKTYGRELRSYDMKNGNIEEALTYDIIFNIHLWVKEMLKRKGSPVKYFNENLEKFKNKVIIGDEIGSGIVPVDPFERNWRDETGWLYQVISANSDRVDRIFAGLSVNLKNQEHE